VYITFEKVIKTKGYELVLMHSGSDGSVAGRWWDWALMRHPRREIEIPVKQRRFFLSSGSAWNICALSRRRTFDAKVQA
jgi:hypothetical protein